MSSPKRGSAPGTIPDQRRTTPLRFVSHRVREKYKTSAMNPVSAARDQ
jgi:hypothetical protein